MGNSPTTESIEKAALQLDASARLKLTRMLVDSLLGLDEHGVSELWLEEAERRDHEIEAGQVKLLPGAAVLAQIRARHSSQTVALHDPLPGTARSDSHLGVRASK